MNYIHQLQESNTQQAKEIAALKSGLIALEQYMLSPKFRHDPTVQSADVLHRIDEIRQNANDTQAHN